MKLRWPAWRIATIAVVAVILLADVGLGVLLWQTSRETPEELAAQRDRLAAEAKLLDADVARGEKIRASLTRVGKDCDNFYQTSFLNSGTVYSAIDTDIADIAAKSGVKTSGFTFKRTDIKDRGVAELAIDTSVDGDYSALLKFVNGIERSKNFYFLNGLQLGSAGPGGIRLQIELHTYFRI
jgi:Tfp pilus assembly protein PilO